MSNTYYMHHSYQLGGLGFRADVSAWRFNLDAFLERDHDRAVFDLAPKGSTE